MRTNKAVLIRRTTSRTCQRCCAALRRKVRTLIQAISAFIGSGKDKPRSELGLETWFPVQS